MKASCDGATTQKVLSSWSKSVWKLRFIEKLNSKLIIASCLSNQSASVNESYVSCDLVLSDAQLGKMSYCETNPEKLRKLNEEAKSKPDRDLGFYPSAMAVTDKWLTRVFSPSDPYHSGSSFQCLFFR